MPEKKKKPSLERLNRRKADLEKQVAKTGFVNAIHNLAKIEQEIEALQAKKTKR